MTPLPHRYEVSLSGGPRGYARLHAAGLPELSIAAPVEFDGPGDAWSPEHLLLASVEACFLLTLRSVALRSKVGFESLELDIEGTVDRQDGVTRFTAIVLRPKIVVAAGANREQIERILVKSEQACLVSASLSTPIRMEPVITEQR